jgi:Zn-dependent protease/predicted transcriptional regulator
MGWSFRILRVAGIDIKIHVTFFLILLLGALSGARTNENMVAGALFGMLLMVLLFVCVTLHELGHSLAARAFGIPTREIVLLPLGGVALLSRNPSKPMHELIIAAAGPFVNVLIAGALFLALGLTAAIQQNNLADVFSFAPTPTMNLASTLGWLLQANIMLILFNMIPAFPLDGGRILRAVLAMVMPAQRATRIATLIGQGLAILIGAFGLLTGQWLLTLVAVFIFLGAGQENNEGQARTMLTTLRVGDAYNKHALTLQTGDRVSKVVDYILTSYQPDYAVLHSNQLAGVVFRDDVLRALATNQTDLYVSSIMRRDIARVDANMTLDQVRDIMGERSARVVAVYRGENYLGLVSIEDIAEAFAVLAFLNQQRTQQMYPGARPGEATVPPPIPSTSTEQHTPTPPTEHHTPATPTVIITPPPSPLSEEDAEREAQLAARRRRLNALEIQYRYFGNQTPTNIVNEIEQLRHEITDLEGQKPVSTN